MLFMITACQTTLAQNAGFFMTADIGAGLPSGVGNLPGSNGNIYTNVPYSLGSGFNFDIGGTYMSGKYLGAGLDLTGIWGFDQKASLILPSVSVVTKKTGSLLAVTPTITLSANSAKINPYARFGIVVGVPSYTVSTTETGQNFVQGTNIDVYSGGFSVGWYSAIGIQYPLNKRLTINAELFDRDLSYVATTKTNTQAYNGQQTAPVQTLVTKDNNPNNSQEFASYVPFGSIGIKIGIAMKIEKGNKPHKVKKKREKRT